MQFGSSCIFAFFLCDCPSQHCRTFQILVIPLVTFYSGNLRKCTDFRKNLPKRQVTGSNSSVSYVFLHFLPKNIPKHNFFQTSKSIRLKSISGHTADSGHSEFVNFRLYLTVHLDLIIGRSDFSSFLSIEIN